MILHVLALTGALALGVWALAAVTVAGLVLLVRALAVGEADGSTADDDPVWWPQFERDFAAYVARETSGRAPEARR